MQQSDITERAKTIALCATSLYPECSTLADAVELAVEIVEYAEQKDRSIVLAQWKPDLDEEMDAKREMRRSRFLTE